MKVKLLTVLVDFDTWDSLFGGNPLFVSNLFSRSNSISEETASRLSPVRSGSHLLLLIHFIDPLTGLNKVEKSHKITKRT